MAIASEHTNQHKFNTLYLFDEKRWYGSERAAQRHDPNGETPEQYAAALEGVVTDLIIMVYGHFSGGTMGWTSTMINRVSDYYVPENRLEEVIAAMHAKGIRVHADFNTCRVDATKGLFPPHKPAGTRFVNVHNPKFQAFISDLVAECAEKYPVDGVCLDFIRTDDFTSPRDGAGNIPKNDASIENIVRMVYEKTKAVKPECIVSSTTVPWIDITHPTYLRTGRKAINWANEGIQDIIFGFEYGNPPDMEVQNIEGIRALITNGTPVIGMYASWVRNADGQVHKSPQSFEQRLILSPLRKLLQFTLVGCLQTNILNY